MSEATIVPLTDGVRQAVFVRGLVLPDWYCPESLIPEEGDRILAYDLTYGEVVVAFIRGSWVLSHDHETAADPVLIFPIPIGHMLPGDAGEAQLAAVRAIRANPPCKRRDEAGVEHYRRVNAWRAPKTAAAR